MAVLAVHHSQYMLLDNQRSLEDNTVHIYVCKYGPVGVLGTLFRVQIAVGFVRVFIVSGREKLNQFFRTKCIMIFFHVSPSVSPKNKI